MTKDTREAVARALEQQDERASVKIMIKDYADGWYELNLAHRPTVGNLLTALEPAPQAGPRELHAVAGATYAPVYAALYPALVEITRKHGYALAVHGSLARDFDLICVPWISRPSPAELVIQDVVDAFAFDAIGSPETKEHGRLVQTLAYVGECFLDLSFIPPMRTRGQLNAYLTENGFHQ